MYVMFIYLTLSGFQDKTNEDVPMPTYFRFLVLLGFKIFAEEQVHYIIF